MRWQGRPVCSHCGSTGAHYFLTPKNGTTRKTRTGAESARRVWKCRDCKRQFSVLTGTVMHRTKVPVRTWLFVMFEMSASKNGVAAREIERKYRVTPRTAWHMTHRIREAMRRGSFTETMRGTVMADETYIGGKAKNKHANAEFVPKTPVLSLVSADTGEVRSVVMPEVTGATLRKAISEHVNMRPSVLVTDELRAYKMLSDEFSDHVAVNHSNGRYVSHGMSTNAVEGFFAQLKRSVDGTHHHISTTHLQRYLDEFDFRYTTREMNDTERMERLVGQVAGRRLTYRPSSVEPLPALVA